MAGRYMVMFLIFVVLSSAFVITVTAETDSDYGQYPFRFIRVTKTEGTTSYLVMVEYEADAIPIVFLTVDGISTEVAQSHLRLGVVEVQVPKIKTGRYNYDAISFLCQNVGMIHLHLDLNSSSTTMEVPRIHAGIKQGSEVTFPPGGDFEFDFTYRPEGNATYNAVYTRVLIKSEDEENVVQRFNIQYNEQAPVTIDPVRFAGDITHFNFTFRVSSSDGRRDVSSLR